MKKLKVFHSSEYFADIGAHVMPIRKFQLVRDQLVKRGIVKENDITAPKPVTKKDLRRVHSKKYVNAVMNGKPLELAESNTFKWSPELARGVRLTNGGCYEAGQYAIENGGIVANLASGFHHAMRESGCGFCTFNGLIVGARKLQAEKRVKKVMVIDCDQHYGNGTRDTTLDDNSIFTFSAFGSGLGYKGQAYDTGETSLAVDICALTENKKEVDLSDYMKALSSLPEILDTFKPDLVYYQAGMDPLSSDPMSCSNLSHADLKERDRYVFELLKSRGIPTVYVLAGGYTNPVEVVVEGHVNTAMVALEVMNASVFSSVREKVLKALAGFKMALAGFLVRVNALNPYKRIADLETMVKLNYKDIAKLEKRVKELENKRRVSLPLILHDIIEDDIPVDSFKFEKPYSIHDQPLERFEDIDFPDGDAA